MATSNSLAPTTSNEQFYTSKYGRITILNGDNYPLWEQTCRIALVVANAWGIVNGTEERPVAPAARVQEYDERLCRAILLITSSVASTQLNYVNPFVPQSDRRGMWLELAKGNRALDPIYQDTLLNRFARESWDPSAESLRTYVNRLDLFHGNHLIIGMITWHTLSHGTYIIRVNCKLAQQQLLDNTTARIHEPYPLFW
jgi:hypothetical protein